MSGKVEIAFDITGFTNWKEPLTDFKNYDGSAKHREFTSRWIQHTKGKSINAHLMKQVKEDQEKNREALQAEVTTLRYLARQGLSLRGHEDKEGNFRKFMNYVRQSVIV